MPHIAELSSHIADLIAAGEVVERPASVVKELVENAMDAGATDITVEIQNGGITFLRVSDNGCGIAAEELPVAFLRHATSKMRSAEDLASIHTLGFRGEALAAISSVSHVDIFSREEQASSGASLHLDAGKPQNTEPAGVPVGTTIVVRDLFYNTPARLKFLKKDTAESAAIHTLLQHLAVSHPSISFRLIKDGEELLQTSGDGQLASAIYAAFGREFSQSLLPVKGTRDAYSIEGFVSRPVASKGSRSLQMFFVNGRFVKSQLLTAALEEAYRNQIMKGKFPCCVLHLTLPYDLVDVNVHPAKTVVKFLQERAAFDAVYYPVIDALTPKTAPEVKENVPLSPLSSAEKRPQNPSEFYRTMSAQEFRSFQTPLPERKPVSVTSVSEKTVFPDRPAPAPIFQQAQESVFVPAPPKPEVPPVPQETFEQESLPSVKAPAPWKIAGEILDTYIVCEDLEHHDVYLIDKHAAHERINFDRLKAQQGPVMSQTLLSPSVVSLDKELCASLLDQFPLLERFGFACEDFGNGSLLVREIPADLQESELADTLEEMAQSLMLGQTPDERYDQILHTVACKSAIKAGMHSDEKELRRLVDRVQSGEIRYCPHGRPVVQKITQYELEKMFKRVT